MKYCAIFSFLFFFSGCHKAEKTSNFISIPPPPDFNVAIPPPPNIAPAIYKVQINSVPMPFHLAHCYIVWVDGKRIMLNSKETFELAKALNLPTDPPQDTKELHDGKGWHKPLEIVNY